MTFTGLSDEVVAKLDKAITLLFEKSNGTTICVSEYSFNDLADDAEIDRRFITYLISTLVDMKALEIKNIKRWMTYKTIVPYVDHDKIIKECEIRHEMYLNEIGLKKKQKDDNKPLFQKNETIGVDIKPATIVPSNKYHAMESKVYVMRQNKIYEGIVIGIVPSEKGYKHQLLFDQSVVINPEEPIEYFSYSCLFPNVKALIISLEKNLIKMSKK